MPGHSCSILQNIYWVWEVRPKWHLHSYILLIFKAEQGNEETEWDWRWSYGKAKNLHTFKDPQSS